MSLLIPSRKNITDSLRNYVRGELPTLDPSTERRSFIGGLVKGLGSALEDWYIFFKRWADREPWPQFATPEGSLYSGWWIPLTKLQPLPAVPANGFVAVTGTNGSVVPAGSLFQGATTTYAAQIAATIVQQSFLAASLTYDSGTGLATFVAANPHFLGTGMTVNITGAVQVAFNGNFQITVVDDVTLTYQPLGAPVATPATGSPVVTATFAAVAVEATTTGFGTNSDSGSQLSVNSLTGVDSVAYVTAGGIGGGTDIETSDAFRARVLQALGTDYGMFTADEISIVAKQVPGVTRVMVRKAEVYPVSDLGFPVEGQVKIAFLRDNDANPLPTAQEVADVKNRIVSLLMPAHTAEEDVIVMSPAPFAVDFSFSSLVPDTPGMRRSITAALMQFFKEEAPWGGTVTVDDYRCVIKAAFDFDTRQRLKSFSLSAPTSDIIAGTTPGYDPDDMAVLGTITFP